MAKTVGNATGQANDFTVATGSGAIDSDTQRVVLATDQPAVTVRGATAVLPVDTDTYVPVRQLPEVKKRYGFDRAITNGVHTDMTLVMTGSGQTVNQTAGSLVITAGTTARSETIIRSNDAFLGALTMRYSCTLSQRINNNNFYVELVDVIGDALTYTIDSATALRVTIPSNPFTAQHVGQSMTIGAFSGTGTFVSGNYPIASISGNDVTFTVSGFATGTGTCSAFGWNYHHVLYNATVATTALYGNQRAGYATADISATINTSASPGHVGIVNVENGISAYSDQVSASSTSVQTSIRAQNVRNVPEEETTLKLQIRSRNDTSAPATGTTWTIGFVDVENYVPSQVAIGSIRSQAFNSAIPVNVGNTVTTTMTATTLTAVVPGVAATSLGKAEDAVAASGDTGVFMLGVQRAAPVSNAATGDYVEFQLSPSNGQFVTPSPIIVATVLTPTIDTAAYVADDRVGSIITIPAALATGRAGLIIGATLVDKAKAKATLELWVFKVSPTLVGADNAAFDITDANLLTALYVGHIDFAAANYADTASNSVCAGVFHAGALAIPYVTSGSANLFGVFVSRGTPTYGSTTDLVLEVLTTQY